MLLSEWQLGSLTPGNRVLSKIEVIHALVDREMVNFISVTEANEMSRKNLMGRGWTKELPFPPVKESSILKQD